MKELYKKLVKKYLSLSKKRQVFYSVALFSVLLIIIIPFSVKAGIGGAIASLFGWVISVIIEVLALLVNLEINIFHKFAQFNNFLNVTAVKEGWKLMRDLCNMFFIVILLIISFATILKLESYSYKKWLGKLVIAAILINFSKTITGILIGFSQVVMLTFVSAFKDAVAGNLAQGLHLKEMMSVSLSKETKFITDNSGNSGGVAGDAADALTVFGTLFLALALILVLVVVMLIIIVVLVGRIVSLWVLVILSPVAYLLQASPFGQKYAKQWWQELGKNLISGPVLAFFLWLAFLTIQKSGEKGVADMRVGETNDEESFLPSSNEIPTFLSGISKTTYMMDYIVTIALLLAAIKLTQSMGVIGSSFAGKMQQNLGGLAKKVAYKPVEKVKQGVVDPLNAQISKLPGAGYIPGTYRNLANKAKKEEALKVRRDGYISSIDAHARKSYNKGGIHKFLNASAVEAPADLKNRLDPVGWIKSAYKDSKSGADKFGFGDNKIDKKKEEKEVIDKTVEADLKVVAEMKGFGDGYINNDSKEKALNEKEQEITGIQKELDQIQEPQKEINKIDKENEGLNSEVSDLEAENKKLHENTQKRNISIEDKQNNEVKIKENEKIIQEKKEQVEVNNGKKRVLEEQSKGSSDQVEKLSQKLTILKSEKENIEKTKVFSSLKKEDYENTLNSQRNREKNRIGELEKEGLLKKKDAKIKNDEIDNYYNVQVDNLKEFDNLETVEEKDEFAKNFQGDLNKRANYISKDSQERQQVISDYIINYAPNLSKTNLIAGKEEIEAAKEKFNSLLGASGKDQSVQARNSIKNKNAAEISEILSIMGEEANFDDLLDSLGYRSDATGFTKMIQEQLIDKGMDEQVALAIQDKVGKACGRGGDYEFIKSVKIDLDGNFKAVIDKNKGYDAQDHNEILQKHVGHVLEPQIAARNLRSNFYVANDGEFNEPAIAFLKSNSKLLKKHVNRMKYDVVEAINANKEMLILNGVDKEFLEEISKVVSDKVVSEKK